MKPGSSIRVLASGVILGGMLYASSPEDFDLRIVRAATTDQGEISVVAPGGSVDLEVTLTTRVKWTEGWSIGAILERDPGVSASITSLEFGPALATINEGDLPFYCVLEWWTPEDPPASGGKRYPNSSPWTAINAEAFTHFMKIALCGSVKLPVTPRLVCVCLSVQVEGPVGGQARLVFSDEVGDPPLPTVVDATFALQPAVQAPATITIREFIPFRRGDTNGDGKLDISDGVCVLSYLFGSRRHLDCHDAADANDDGRLDISDGVRVFSYLFGSRSPLQAPFLICGADLTKDGVNCDFYPACE